MLYSASAFHAADRGFETRLEAGEQKFGTTRGWVNDNRIAIFVGELLKKWLIEFIFHRELHSWTSILKDQKG